MRKVIVYSSVHHGNTEKLVKNIAEECQVDLIDAVKQPDADLSSYDMIGFASGIYVEVQQELGIGRTSFYKMKKQALGYLGFYFYEIVVPQAKDKRFKPSLGVEEE